MSQTADRAPVAEDLEVASVRLRLWRLNHADPARPLVLLLHGMRDVGRSLMPVARILEPHFNVVLLDQRGHGASDYPGAYSMTYFYYDLHQVLAHLQAQHPQRPAALIAHSLGGQIASRFAGLFAEQVQALVLVEGLGPPDPSWPTPRSEQAFDLPGYRALVLDRMALPPRLRPLPDRDFAITRLLHNNPRLAPEQAKALARVAVREETVAGARELHWAFDPRVAAAFVGMTADDGPPLWAAIAAPVLTITGDLADEYWRGAMHYGEGYSGRFQPGEYEARIQPFPNIRHERFDGSGHMVHFDEPERLAKRCLSFLEETLR